MSWLRWLGKLFWGGARSSPPPPEADPAAFTVVECVSLGRHRYRVTTESERYGRVTQTVVMFPREFFDPHPTATPSATTSPAPDPATTSTQENRSGLPSRRNSTGTA